MVIQSTSSSSQRGLPKTVTLEDVKQASRRISQHAHRTPVLTSQTLSRIAGHQLFFKCENFQKTGSFKFRGAFNAVSQLTDEQRVRGVVTHSSGNHAAALALAASIFETPAHIVMPNNSSHVKRRAVLEYGGKIVDCEPNLPSRQDVADQVQRQTGATMIPPFNHAWIIAGQATVALEMMRQVPHLDYVVAPIGGGGLISGTCVAVKSIAGRCNVIGAEPLGADDASRSKMANQLLPQENPRTIADGLLTSMGQLTWPYVRDVVEQVVTVADSEIVEGMKLFLERTKILIEPSSAVALAVALKAGSFVTDNNRNIGVIISGGNVDLDHLPW
jgi:threonine dehydratase/serine racemase